MREDVHEEPAVQQGPRGKRIMMKGGRVRVPPPLMPLGRAASTAAVRAPRLAYRWSLGKEHLPNAACSTPVLSALHPQQTQSGHLSTASSAQSALVAPNAGKSQTFMAA